MSSMGMPSRRKPWSAATSSDSVELWLEAVCFVLTPCSGNQVFGPHITKNTPDVDFLVSLQDARSASVYRRSTQSSRASPMKPCWKTSSFVVQT